LGLQELLVPLACGIVVAAIAASAGPALASEGEARVIEARVGEVVTLTPPDGITPGTAYWVELSGPAMLLRRGETARPELRLRPRVPGRYVLACLRSPGSSLRGAALVEMKVEGPHRPSAVLTGPLRAGAGEEVAIGVTWTVAANDGSLLGGRWRQLSGPRLRPRRGELEQPLLSLTPDEAGRYRIAVSLDLTGIRTPWATFTFEIPRRADGSPEHRPVARVAPMLTVRAGEKVVLDGSRSADPDGDPVTFRWEKLSGPPGEIVGEGARVAFYPAFAGQYGFQLTVTDPAGLVSRPLGVLLSVSEPPEPPRASPDAADPLDRPFSAKLENARLAALLARLADAGVTVRASREVTESHPFHEFRVDLWAVELPARKVLDWLGRSLEAFYVVEAPGVVWYTRGTRWLEREELASETYRIDALHPEGDARELEALLCEAVRAALWARPEANLGPADLEKDTLTAVLPRTAQARVGRVLAELRRDRPSGPPPRMEAEEAVERLRLRPVEARYRGWSAREVAWDLARQARVPVGFPPLGESGGPEVSLDLGPTTFEKALAALAGAAGFDGFLLEPPGAAWLYRGGRGPGPVEGRDAEGDGAGPREASPPPETSECPWTAAEVRSYDCRGLPGPLVAHLVKRRVRPELWEGPFVTVGYSRARGRLLVIHFREVHRAVPALLDDLARKGPAALDPRDPIPHRELAEVFKKLGDEERAAYHLGLYRALLAVQEAAPRRRGRPRRPARFLRASPGRWRGGPHRTQSVSLSRG
jgi:hypothetical protein